MSKLAGIQFPLEQAVLTGLVASAQKQELRDEADEFPESFSAFVFSVLRAFIASVEPSQTRDLGNILISICKYPESAEVLGSNPPADLFQLVDSLVVDLSSSTSQKAHACIFVLHTVYSGFHDREIRSSIRKQLSRILVDYGKVPNRSTSISPVLIVFERILAGVHGQVARPVVEQYLVRVLLPLFQVNGWQIFDRQEPYLASYWKTLMSCIETCLSVAPEINRNLVLNGILHGFPAGAALTNSAKELLLWTGLKKFIPAEPGFPEEKLLLERVIKTLNSENANLVQTALSLWKEGAWTSYVEKAGVRVVNALLPAILRDGKPHWNPTVNKMTVLVLDALHDAGLLEPCELSSGDAASAFTAQAAPVATSSGAPQLEGNWRNFAVAGSDPSIDLTGVAPWKKEPLLVVDTTTAGESVSGPTEISVHAFREALASFRPTADAEGGGRSWEEALAASSAVTLQNLKFHDLVFGKELGRGAFGVVRYARAVDKKSSISSWPEFAVKMVEFVKFPNVIKEVAVLQKLTHPGVARLVSFFSLSSPVPTLVAVLEYGALGDLHTYVTTQGVLDEDEARQVGAEIAGALQTVHAAGFVYADVKPENVVLLFNRHVKLTDFGAALPVTSEARDAVFKHKTRIRAGEWNRQQVEELTYDVDEFEEFAIEGTTTYMAAEVFNSNSPSFLSDAFSFGVLLFFISTARLPHLSDENDNSVKFVIDRSPLENLAIRPVVDALLEIDPTKRLPIAALDDNDFFAPLSPLVQAFRKPLSQGHLKNATAAGIRSTSNDPWSKRQLSRVWTTLPSDLDVQDERSAELAPIPADPADLLDSWY